MATFNPWWTIFHQFTDKAEVFQCIIPTSHNKKRQLPPILEITHISHLLRIDNLFRTVCLLRIHTKNPILSSKKTSNHKKCDMIFYFPPLSYQQFNENYLMLIQGRTKNSYLNDKYKVLEVNSIKLCVKWLFKYYVIVGKEFWRKTFNLVDVVWLIWVFLMFRRFVVLVLYLKTAAKAFKASVVENFHLKEKINLEI